MVWLIQHATHTYWALLQWELGNLLSFYDHSTFCSLYTFISCKFGSDEAKQCYVMNCSTQQQSSAYIFYLCVPQQGVVTYTSPVEAFVTGIKNLDRLKSSLIA